MATFNKTCADIHDEGAREFVMEEMESGNGDARRENIAQCVSHLRFCKRIRKYWDDTTESSPRMSDTTTLVRIKLNERDANKWKKKGRQDCDGNVHVNRCFCPSAREGY